MGGVGCLWFTRLLEWVYGGVLVCASLVCWNELMGGCWFVVRSVRWNGLLVCGSLVWWNGWVGGVGSL